MKTLLATPLLIASIAAHAEPFLIGIDSKVEFRREGVTLLEPGEDMICLMQIPNDPAKVSIKEQIPLSNSVFGPPTNLAISPDGKIAVVACAVDWAETDGKWSAEPDERLFVLDLENKPIEVIQTVKVDIQPSGISFSQDGTRLATANRKGQSVTLLSVKDKRLTVEATIGVEGQASAVSFTPKGSYILASKFSEHAVAIIKVAPDGKSMSYDPSDDLHVGRWPYNVKVSPTGQLALAANNGNGGFPDGHADTVSVINLKSTPAHVSDHVVVGDGPEGLVFSPKGTYAAVALLNGSADMFLDKWFHNDNGYVVLLGIEGTSVRVLDRIEVGGFPEGMHFSPDERFLYVGNYNNKDLSVIEINGGLMREVKRVKLPGMPGSVGGRY